MGRWTALLPLLLTALLTGCSGAGGPPPGSGNRPAAPVADAHPAGATPDGSQSHQEPPDQGPAPDPGPPPDQRPAPEPEPLPDQGPVTPDQVLAPAPPDSLAHFQVAPGQPIGRAGLFFMQVATGAVEGWQVAGEPNARYEASPDNRWVIASGPEKSYLVDRQTGEQYAWPREEARLLAAQGDTLVMETGNALWLGRPGRWQAIGPELKPNRPQALLAPDGQALLLVNGQAVYLVEPPGGIARRVGIVELRAGEEPPQVHLDLIRRGQEAAVVATFNPWGPPEQRRTQLQRYSWQGERLAEAALPGWGMTPYAWGGFSPAGDLFAYTEYLDSFTTAVVVAGADDLEPRFRVKGADTCTEEAVPGSRWLADGSGLVVRVRGGHRILTADGRLLELPALAGTDSLVEPMPAPDRPDRFAIGRLRVVSASGEPLAAALPHGEGQWLGPGSLAPWGYRSDELRFVLGAGGHGPRCGEFALPPQVEKPPFSHRAGLTRASWKDSPVR